MARVKIFEPCDMEYEVYDKPVRYTEEFLKELASQCSNAALVKEKHRGENIGTVSNITFTDGALWADVTTEEALDNLMYSPSYDSTLIDKGDHWLATKGKLLEVALTSEPRRAILTILLIIMEEVRWEIIIMIVTMELSSSFKTKSKDFKKKITNLISN